MENATEIDVEMGPEITPTAPPCYNDCPPNYQRIDPANSEPAPLSDLGIYATIFMNNLVDYYKQIEKQSNNEIVPADRVIFKMRPDGFFSETRLIEIYQRDRSSKKISENFIFRPDGVWRDGTRARIIDNSTLLVETRCKEEIDGHLPQYRIIKKYGYKLSEKEDGLKVLEFSYNGSNVTDYTASAPGPNCSFCRNFCLVISFIFLVILSMLASKYRREKRYY